MNASRFFALLYPLLFAALLHAQAISGGTPFSDPASETRYTRLIHTIRCPTCQNQSIAESGAPLATELRRLVVKQITQGKNDAEIVNYLIARYGAFISYDPRLEKSTLILWFGPPLMLLLAALGFFRVHRKRAKHRPCSAESELIHEED